MPRILYLVRPNGWRGTLLISGMWQEVVASGFMSTNGTVALAYLTCVFSEYTAIWYIESGHNYPNYNDLWEPIENANYLSRFQLNDSNKTFQYCCFG